jgi:Uma2 family endonuclease
MSGASIKHNIIFSNLFGILTISLKGKSCFSFGSDFRVHVKENGLYTYPDISIVCHDAEIIDDEYKDNLLNPSVLIEILSKSTRDYDKGRKFFLYKSIPTLQEYILIDSLNILVKIFRRNEDNSWTLTEYNKESVSFNIQSIDLTVRMNDVYEKLKF